jgi:hypothetical protein
MGFKIPSFKIPNFKISLLNRFRRRFLQTSSGAIAGTALAQTRHPSSIAAIPVSSAEGAIATTTLAVASSYPGNFFPGLASGFLTRRNENRAEKLTDEELGFEMASLSPETRTPLTVSLA